MKKRAFIAGLGGAVAWPLSGHASKRSEVVASAFCSPALARPIRSQPHADAFRIQLEELG